MEQDKLKPTVGFQEVKLSDGSVHKVPQDIQLRLPEISSLPTDKLHYLVFIPWDEKYLKFVEDSYKDIFIKTLPYLHVRTTDIHTARCIPFVNELIEAIGQPVQEEVVYLGVILHDCGWYMLTEAEVADSLGVKGLALSGEAVNPKEKHAQEGAKIAEQILADYPLSEEHKSMIIKAVLYHDKPWELAAGRDIPLEVKVICDVDHLWSFTHENFWQDTVRKGVPPEEYLANLEKDLDGYFVTNEAKGMARRLLEERRSEVEALNELNNN